MKLPGIFAVLLAVAALAVCVSAVPTIKIGSTGTGTANSCSNALCQDSSQLFYITEAMPIPDTSKEFDKIVKAGDSGFKFAGLRSMNASEMRRFLEWVKNDKTHLNKEVPGKYSCTQYSLDLIRNASLADFHNLYFVQISPFSFGRSARHNGVGMYDKDHGLIVYDAQYNTIINRMILCSGVPEKICICDPRLVTLKGFNADGDAIADVPYISVYFKETNGKISNCLYNTTTIGD